MIVAGLVLTGCWDAQEIDKRTIVAAIAIDKARDGYDLSIQVPVPQLVAGGGGGGGEGGSKGGGPEAIQIFSANGTTISEAIYKIAQQNSQPLFFGHTVTILFSEEVARDGVAKVIDSFRRDPQIRRQLWPAVVQGKAEKALTVKTKLDQIPAYYLREILETNEKLGRTPRMVLGDLFKNISNPFMGASLINYITPTGNGYKWDGLAVFDRDRMVGKLEKIETTPVVQIREQKKGWLVKASCPDRRGNVIFRPTRVKKNFQFSKRPSIDINITVEGTIIERTCSLNLSDPKVMSQVEKQLAQVYRENADSLVKKAQKQLKVDIFHFGKYIHAYYPEVWERREWRKQFPETPIRFNYRVKVRRIGMEAE
nr:Ger(x)C family spore germination protein [Paenactinomyces guangxiensis]